MTVKFAKYTIFPEMFPFQIQGMTEDNQHFYFRYRHCSISFGLGIDPDYAVQNSISNVELTRHVGMDMCPHCCDELSIEEAEKLANQIIEETNE